MPAPSSAEARSILALVKKADPKAEALVNVQNTHRANTRFARNEITTSAESDDSRVTLTVQLGLRSATANTNQKSPAALQSLVLAMPEILLLTLALDVALGKWRGLRLIEYVRFFGATGKGYEPMDAAEPARRSGERGRR